MELMEFYKVVTFFPNTCFITKRPNCGIQQSTLVIGRDVTINNSMGVEMLNIRH